MKIMYHCSLALIFILYNACTVCCCHLYCIRHCMSFPFFFEKKLGNLLFHLVYFFKCPQKASFLMTRKAKKKKKFTNDAFVIAFQDGCCLCTKWTELNEKIFNLLLKPYCFRSFISFRLEICCLFCHNRVIAS